MTGAVSAGLLAAAAADPDHDLHALDPLMRLLLVLVVRLLLLTLLLRLHRLPLHVLLVLPSS